MESKCFNIYSKVEFSLIHSIAVFAFADRPLAILRRKTAKTSASRASKRCANARASSTSLLSKCAVAKRMRSSKRKNRYVAYY